MSVKDEEQQGLVFEEKETGTVTADEVAESSEADNSENNIDMVSETPAEEKAETAEDTESVEEKSSPDDVSAEVAADKAETDTEEASKKRGRRKKIRIEVIKEAADPLESINGVEIGSVDIESAEKAALSTRNNQEDGEDDNPKQIRKPKVKANRRVSARKKKGDRNNGEIREKMSINELTMMNLPDLREFATKFDLSMDTLISMKKQEIIFSVLKAHTNNNGIIYAHGSLEILPDGYGFLRSAFNSYLPGSDDIYISPSQIRLFNLRTGDTVGGQIRPPKEGERFFAMLRVEQVNFADPTEAQVRIPFDSLTPLYPHERINMETTAEDNIATRMINLFCPIGKGQRGLIVSPPRTGKTIMLQQLANAITTNHPEIFCDCTSDR